MSAKALHESHKKPNDIIYTPQPIAQIMINMVDIQKDQKVLDPSKGAGIFYDNLPDCNKDWCELPERDFFENNEQYDIIVGNPPFSLWTKWLKHTLTKSTGLSALGV
jgi:type I restriction-modification system DNA methylase subunit